jgi:GMP synthase (glutamine-hydrolysing)
VLVVKTGSTLPELRRRRGDYEDWILAAMGVPRERARVVDVCRGEPLPAPDDPAVLVVTGSAAFVSDREPWSERTADWLAQAVHAGTPVLGICYGHQLLAQGLGGRVGRNPRGREIGTVEVDLLDGAEADRLLCALPLRIAVQATHVESVLALPPAARLLGASPADPHSVFAVGTTAWGVQFHPEFDAEVMRVYLEARREILRAEGLDPEALLRRVADSGHGAALLRRFASLARR